MEASIGTEEGSARYQGSMTGPDGGRGQRRKELLRGAWLPCWEALLLLAFPTLSAAAVLCLPSSASFLRPQGSVSVALAGILRIGRAIPCKKANVNFKNCFEIAQLYSFLLVLLQSLQKSQAHMSLSRQVVLQSESAVSP